MGNDEEKPIKHKTQIDVEEIVHRKVAKLEQAVDGELRTLTAMQECQKRIIDFTKSRLEDYYRLYPERANDDRSRSAEDWSIMGIKEILNIVGDYKLDFK